MNALFFLDNSIQYCCSGKGEGGGGFQGFDLPRLFRKLYFHCSLFSCHTLVAMVTWELYSMGADANMLTAHSGKLHPSQVDTRSSNYSINKARSNRKTWHVPYVDIRGSL